MRKSDYITSVLFLFILGCAQVGSLTGGPKDTEAPILLKSTPEKQTLNFKGNKLTFKFDEFFVLSDLNSVFLCSPPLLEKPDFKIKRKKFIVKFNEKLKDSTTYMFWFANAIQDNNEKNPYKDFKFVFSTGNDIDTMEISGVIKDAFSSKPDEGMYVLLYKNFTDSTPINEKPYYITKTDTSGKFTIDFIKTGKYRIFALKDLDANLQFNLPNEKIAYLDTFITPSVITETKVDTFKAGSVLQIGNDTVGDTLVNDTVIVHNEYIYSPKNINLFSFEEDNNKQYIVNSSREDRGRCKFEFNKITDSVTISPLNFKLFNNDYLTEKVDTGKSIIYWITNKDLYNNDTISYSVSYFNKDSVNNNVKETDTINFPFNFEKDTLTHNVEFIDLKTQQDSFANYILETNTPISKIDTSKIHIFEVLDTLVSDDKKQKLLKAQRPKPDELFFSLKRPFVKDFFIEKLYEDSIENWYTRSYSEDSTMLNCKIINPNILQEDTLQLIVHFDNNYFKGQIPKTADTLSLPLYKQGIISVKRPATDTIKITFKKKVFNGTSIFIDDFNTPDWYQRIKTDEDNIFLLKINKKFAEDKDTLILTIKTKDYESSKGNIIEFEYTKNAIFRFNKQRIKKTAREERNQFYFIFSKALVNNLNISPINFPNKDNWYSKKANENKDTIVYTITSRTVTNVDTIKLKIEYDIKNKFKEIEQITDTVKFVYKRVRERRKRTAKNDKKSSNKKSTTKNDEASSEKQIKVGINIPIKYEIYRDTSSVSKLSITYPWKSGKSYFLKMDSLALYDVYNNYSKKTETNFNILTASSYCKIKVNIINIGNIAKPDFSLVNDTTITDTLISSNLEKGQILLSLYDEKNNLVKTNLTSSDTSFVINKLKPGKYSIKIIYDENMNKKWDTGKYIKHLQPEKVIIYSEEINLSEGDKKEIEWTL